MTIQTWHSLYIVRKYSKVYFKLDLFSLFKIRLNLLQCIGTDIVTQISIKVISKLQHNGAN